MTKAGIRLSDVGEDFTWNDLRDFINHVPPSGDTALYRSLYPKSWWWEPSFDFLAATLNAIQWGNWQRGGGKGDKPKAIKRPKDALMKSPKTAAEVEAKRQKVKAAQQRRAVQRGD